MEKADYAEFKKIWEGACEHFPTKKPSETAMFLAFGCLSQYHLNDVKRALMACLRTSKFMPTIATVEDWLQGGPVEDRARMAYRAVADAMRRLRSDTSVRLNDPYATYAVQACGGWTSICRMRPDESEPLFCKYYETAARQRITDVPDHLAGNIEISGRYLNASGEFEDWKPDKVQNVWVFKNNQTRMIGG